MLDHWHPLCPSKRVARKPVGVSLCGRPLVAFRGTDGSVGILADACPHRRMKLSCGHVEGDRLVCPYHGWTFSRAGAGESPGTPKLHTCAPAFDVHESHGFIWVRTPDSNATFPTLGLPDYTSVRPVEKLINAPLELVLDNFTEVEHAATVHKYIGYSLSDMHRVRSVISANSDSVSVDNSGPQKPLPTFMRLLFGIPGNAEFHWEWVTRFSPVFTTYTEFWTLPGSEDRIGVSARIRVFFCPVDDETTRLVVFPSFRLPYSRPISKLCLQFREIARQLVKFEIHQDAVMIEQLADVRTEIEGMKLSRFDRTLGLHRDRIQAIYRGESGARTHSPKESVSPADCG